MARAAIDNFHPQFANIIWAMMKQEGRNREVCELCGGSTENRPHLHHEKYEGATYYDLKITCAKCNCAPENRFLE